MTENDSTVTTAAAASSAPKKLKLTLKLNSSSISSTPLEGSTSASTTPVSSQVNSSTTASPIKASINSPDSAANLLPLPPPSLGFSDLPSGLGNFKGRGRPKKANEPVKSADEFPINSTALINPNTKSSSSAVTESSSTTTTTTTEKSEYSADLNSFVGSMKTFQSRKWSLKRPLLLETKNLANFDLKWPAGLWTTETFEISTSHLSSVNLAASNNPVSASVDHLAVFEATCKCGKVFNDRSKYRKHAKIHDKPVMKEPLLSVNIVDDDDSVKNNNPTPSPMPTISLKLKLNTNGNGNSIINK